MPIPVPPGGPAVYNPIHEDDIIAMIPKLLEVASVPVDDRQLGRRSVRQHPGVVHLPRLARRQGAGVRGERSGAARKSVGRHQNA